MAPVYFWCASRQDGTNISDPMTESQLKKQLADDLDDEITHTFLTKVPDTDGACWIDVPEDAVLIIKGEIIVPKAASVVTRYEV